MELAKKSLFRRLIFTIGGTLVIALVVVAVRHSSGQISGADGATNAADAAVPVTATTATRQDFP